MLNGIPDDFFWAIFGMVWIFGWVGLGLVWRGQHEKRRLRIREMVHQERMAAIDKGIDPTAIPEAIAALPNGDEASLPGSRHSGKATALVVGLVSLFAGLGVYVGFLLTQDLRDLASLGFILVFVGIGLLLYPVLSRYIR